MHLGFKQNKYGTKVSIHKCEPCGTIFTVCPAKPLTAKGWNGCLGVGCESYDPNRDIDKLFGDDGILKKGKELSRTEHILPTYNR